MKKYILTLMALIATMSISAQEIRVYRNDGTAPIANFCDTETDKYEVVIEEYRDPLIPGFFTVSPGPDGIYDTGDDKHVRFTKSNVFWDGSEFQFEPSQTYSPTTWNPNHVGHFFWTVNAEDSYTKEYNESTTSASDIPFFAESRGGLTIEGISGLYALSKDEWSYLLGELKDPYFGGLNNNIPRRNNAYNLRKHGVTVTHNGKTYTHCLIIAPDSFTGTLKSSYTLTEINNLGLVCLPAAGYRYLDTGTGNMMHKTGESGDYLSSSIYNGALGVNVGERYNYSYYLNFTSLDNEFNNRIIATEYAQRNFAMSLRLVAKIDDIHEYVDLGLPSGTLWATCNIGAWNPWDLGNRYAWGETTTKYEYTWDNYKYAQKVGDDYKLTKYCTDSPKGTRDNKTVLDAADDAASVKWGDHWCMPTKDQCQELIDNCNWTWMTNYNNTGVKGFVISSKKTGNTSSMFLPLAYYWTNALGIDKYNGSYLDEKGYILDTYITIYDPGYGYYITSEDRYKGLPVRPVRKK